MRQVPPWISAPTASPSGRSKVRRTHCGGNSCRSCFFILDELAENLYDVMKKREENLKIISVYV
jgi:hypothetical protein